MADDRQPRRPAETAAAVALWVGSGILAGFAVLVALGSAGQRWIAFGILVANAALLLLWGEAIWHGGFEGRRYRD
jgi:hypothetical protein